MTRFAALLALALAGAPAAAQDARRWAEALGVHQRLAASKDPSERARAAAELGNATSEKHDNLCWKLLSAHLRQELAREGQGGRSEENVSGDVIEACVRAFRKIAHKDVLAEMTKTARARGEHLRVRMAVIWGLALSGDLKDLTELADDKVWQIQISAVDALAERGDAASVPLFLRVLQENRPWEAKHAALQGLEKAGDEKCVEPLLEGLGKCRADEGRLKDLYLRVLKKVTGIELASDDPNAWKAAWAAKREGNDPAKAGVDTMVEPTEFYGLKTRSTRIVFVLDRTGSMLAPGSEPARTVFKLPPDAVGGAKEPPQEAAAREEATRLKKKFDDLRVATRWDAVRKEFVHSVFVLSPRVHFNVVWYESKPDPWKQELVPATWTNKLDCLKHVDRLNASGNTNIWDALEMAFKMVETPQRPDVIQLDRRANYATVVAGADTFFLMTDGLPNEGRVVTTDGILSELRKVNRLRKVAVHVICVGDVVPGAPLGANPDPAFLKRIADENGGEFVHIRK
jgi:hypothetical protein